MSGKVSGRYDFNGHVRAARLGAERLPRALACSSSSSRRRRPTSSTACRSTSRPSRSTDPVAQRAGREGARRREVGELLARRASGASAILSVTVDAYRIDIDDRIVLSENLTQANVRTYLQSQGFIGVGGGRFFINGVDTRDHGRRPRRQRTASDHRRRRPLRLHVHRQLTTRPTSRASRQTQQLSALNPPPPLFDRINVLTFEEGTPRTKFSRRPTGRWGASAPRCAPRATARRSTPAPRPPSTRTLGAKTVVDLEAPREYRRTLPARRSARRTCSTSIRTRSPSSRNATGNTPFSNYAPFGRSGRFRIRPCIADRSEAAAPFLTHRTDDCSRNRKQIAISVAFPTH